MLVTLAAIACAGQQGEVKAPHGPNGETYRYCALSVPRFEVPECIVLLTPEQQSKRWRSDRLVYHAQRLVRVEHVNGVGALLEDEEGVAVERYAYAKDKVAEIIHEDERGVVVRKDSFSSDLTYVHSVDGFDRPLELGQRRTFDARGQMDSYTYVDVHGRMTLTSDGHLVTKVKRDARGAIIERAYFDAEGNPLPDNEGVQRVVYTMDEQGHVPREAFFGADGSPALHLGAHETIHEYDAAGNVSAWTYYGPGRKRIRSTETGSASVKIERDAHGTEIARTHYDELGSPTIATGGYSRLVLKNDRNGDAVEWRYYDVDGAPMRQRGSREHRVLAKRDQRRRVVEEKYYDVNGEPMPIDGGYQQVQTTYDQRGNATLLEFRDSSGALVGTPSSYAVRRHEYDGNWEVRTEYLDHTRQRIEIEWGYAEVRISYDPFGYETARQYFDVAGRLVQPPDRCAGSFDEQQGAEVQSKLESLLTCIDEVHQTYFWLALHFDTEGRVTQSAFVGLENGNGAMRRCMEAKLAQVRVAPSEVAFCRAAMVGIRLEEPRGVYPPE